MVKWYNRTLPMFSRGFDYPWPHEYKNVRTNVRHFCSCGQEKGACAPFVVIETAGAICVACFLEQHISEA